MPAERVWFVVGSGLRPRRIARRWAVRLALFWLAAGSAALTLAQEPGPLEFERDIRPIFRTYCFDCHGATEKKEGGLDLRLVRFLLAGGESGPALVAGRPGESYLLARIRAGEMPPGEGKVPPHLVETLERWIAAGSPVAESEPESLPPGVGISPSERAWWAFRPIERPEIPPIPPASRARGAIDALLSAEMPPGLAFAPEADRRTLIKRLSFDLLGLPPSEEECRSFSADESPGAYERLVERLLASPHYGERWARHWLDVAGYAESEGGPDDPARPWVYKYRDYVIRALNDDKPFDRFLEEQLAGDELAGPLRGDLTAGQVELLTATGFLRLAADPTGGGDNSPEGRERTIADTLKIVGSSLLGVSLACAQCHDHRYDPISQVDYYAVRAVFEPGWDTPAWKTPGQRQVSLATEAERQRAQEIETQVADLAAKRAEKEKEFLAAALEKELAKFPEPERPILRAALDTPAEQRTPEQQQLLATNPQLAITPGVLYQFNPQAAEELKKLDGEIAALRGQKPVEEFLAALVERPGTAAPTHRFHRGDYRQPLEEVLPASLSVLSPTGLPQPLATAATPSGSSGRRLAWARWLTSPENPLTPRVLVNRVWLHHFGRGLAATPADFGRLGVAPSEPRLLDWLASEFRAQGFSLKRLHRLIVNSTAYRQSSDTTPEQRDLDPENRFFARQSLRRLDAESLRDRVLAVTGAIDLTLYGPSIPVSTDDAGQVIVADPDCRRSLYIQQRRSSPVALMEAFDAPVMQTNCEARGSSTAATQTLFLLNGGFLVREAGRLSEAILAAPLAGPPPADVAWGAPLPPLWQFGHGGCDEASGRTASFTPLAHWTGSSWQGGPELPDAQRGWVLLHAEGGHPGENPAFAAIRRFTAPAAGVVSIAGQLGHHSPHGDGVRGRIISSRWGLVGEWSAANQAVSTTSGEIAVEPGDTLDFITDARDTVTSDSFTWPVELKLARDGQPITGWNSATGFHGPGTAAAVPLYPEHVTRLWERVLLRAPGDDELELAAGFLAEQLAHLRAHPEQLPGERAAEVQALANLAHVLLNSNEFLYVD